MTDGRIYCAYYTYVLQVVGSGALRGGWHCAHYIYCAQTKQAGDKPLSTHCGSFESPCLDFYSPEVIMQIA